VEEEGLRRGDLEVMAREVTSWTPWLEVAGLSRDVPGASPGSDSTLEVLGLTPGRDCPLQGPVDARLDRRRDVVDLLLDAHTEARHALALAEGLTGASATEACREAARAVVDYVDVLLPLHAEDEERTIAPKLRGRNPAVDRALDEASRHHRALQPAMARLRALCWLLSRDPTRLHAVRFELEQVVREARGHLDAHHALEESMVFPALKRVLYVDELEDIFDEMRTRRIAMLEGEGGPARA
jgi:hemerythrin-like domain-containing protein